MFKQTLSDEEIHRLVEESVNEVLEALNKGVLLEMAVPRNKYKNRVRSFMKQITENWCLVRYITLKGITRNKKHWCMELQTHMIYLSDQYLLEGDSVKSKRKVFDEVLFENDYDKPKSISLKICAKFFKENFDIKSKEYNQAISDFMNSIEGIINLILSRDESAIRDYINSLLNS